MKFDDGIHNIYEQLVVEELGTLDNSDKSNEYIADLICLSLNQLPPKYIRHDVDLSYYQSISEKHHMSLQVKNAVRKAVEFLREHQPKDAS